MEKKTAKEVKKHKFLACACKSQDFAQGQKNFARSHDRTTARFRNSALTLRKHMHMFCTELEGEKEKGKKIRIINVQPASVRRSKTRGTSRKGRKALGGSGKFKDRSGETGSFILPRLVEKR